MSSNAISKEAALAIAGNPISFAGGANITNLYSNQPGPLPLTGYFTSSGGALLIFVSGCASRRTTSSKAPIARLMSPALS